MEKYTIGFLCRQDPLFTLSDEHLLCSVAETFTLERDFVEILLGAKGNFADKLAARIKSQPAWGKRRVVSTVLATDERIVPCCYGSGFYDRVEFCDPAREKHSPFTPLERYVAERSDLLLCHVPIGTAEWQALSRFAADRSLMVINFADTEENRVKYAYLHGGF